MANTKPLSDLISRTIARGAGIVTDPAVHNGVREIGHAVADLGRSIVRAGTLDTSSRAAESTPDIDQHRT